MEALAVYFGIGLLGALAVTVCHGFPDNWTLYIPLVVGWPFLACALIVAPFE